MAASPWNDPRLVFPDETTWSQLDTAARDRVIETILAVLDEYQVPMLEGVRHYRHKSGAMADLDAHFRRAGRAMFLACELAVCMVQRLRAYGRRPHDVPW